ncbi:MAG TPA: pyridoxal-dependent decarboxylase [Thermoanaerobaculia bacterium]|nr:pyridoxal-dependent decarboxylase [Thermoanaerobaculia bacterium]
MKPLETAFRHALAYLDQLDEMRVGATATLDELRERFDVPLTGDGVDGDAVIDDLVAATRDGLHASPGGRFFAWVIGGTLPAAIAADWLTSVWDQNGPHFSTSPAAAVCEEVTGAWLKDVLRLPNESSFALVTGTQMAHMTCLAAARHGLLAQRGWEVETKGLFGAPPIRVLSSDQRHGSIDRALRFLGIGTSHLEFLDLDPAALERALRDRDEPAIVLMQAGDINTGAFDDFATLIPIAKRYGAWVHVDGAFGLWAAASPKYAGLLEGADAADSWVTDGHKWLNVPFDCAYAFVANRDAHYGSMSHRASYLTHDAVARDAGDWTPEWSRRARSFPTYAALRFLGRNGLADLIERCCRHAYDIVTRIGELPGAEVLAVPIINQGLLRFGDRTDEVIAAINATGEAFFSGTTWRGKRAMRVSVVSWKTTAQDVDRVVNAVAKVLKKD